MIADIDNLLIEANSAYVSRVEDLNRLLASADALFHQQADQRALIRDLEANKFNIFRLTKRPITRLQHIREY
jgi:hypothetical protein